MIANNMLRSVQVAPHVTSVFELDLSATINHRNKIRTEIEKSGAKLTFTTYFVAACAKALQKVPEVNSRWHDDALEVFDDCNIGVGTAVPPKNPGEDAGLVVPVVHSAQRLSLAEIATKLTDLTERARTNSLKPEDIRGGTFTISNHGVSGSLVAAPIIINQPQSAILGIGKLEDRPSVITKADGNSELTIRPKLYVTLTLDHRVLDGFKANAFLSAFVEHLQQPG
jgi:2-oxoglutarate dehydrogenase E2 component (dihydrolipoamide succinyltransferase)